MADTSTITAATTGIQGPAKRRQTPDITSLAGSWLEWQCQMVSGVIHGAVYDPTNISLQSALAVWPDNGRTANQLLAAATQVKKKNSNIQVSKIPYGPNRQRLCDLIACPVYKGNELMAIVAISFSVRSEAQREAVLQLIGWGGLWLDTMVERRERFAEKQHEYVLALSSSIAKQPTASTACMEAVNRLEKSAGCMRVSIGLRANMHTKIEAISNTPDFDRRTRLVELIEMAMEESNDQKRMICFPSSDTRLQIESAHEELSDCSGAKYILSLPLHHTGETTGTILFERDSDQPFDKPTIKFLGAITRLLGATLAHKMAIEQPISSTLHSRLKNQCASFLGREYLSAKIATTIAFSIFVASQFITTSYTVAAPSSIEGALQQVVAAPMNGFVKTTKVRAGDTVNKGESLAVLDNQLLELEKQKYVNEKNEMAQIYQTALASQDRTQTAKLTAQIAQIDSDINLIDAQLKRTTLKAPFSGVVISGDLSQALGSPVELGQVLFEVAPLDNYRVILEVPEGDIQFVQTGNKGQLITKALPKERFDFTIDSISPMASANNSGNYFKVEALLSQHSDLLLPGMKGVAKIETFEKSLWWIWTHKVANKVSVSLWSIGLL